MAVIHAQTSEKLIAQEGDVCLIYPSPWGDMVVRGDKNAIRSLRFQPGQVEHNVEKAEWADDCAHQLKRYCDGQTITFDLPLTANGTEFQQRVWQVLGQIPYGEISSYQQVAEALGSPGSVRAVASANARNPISIVVPCHRVIGSDRALRGYAGGIETKAKLLELEGHRIQAGEITLNSKVLITLDETNAQKEFSLCWR